VIAFRPAEPRDRGFIVSAWATSYQNSLYAGFISFDSWHRVMRPEVIATLDRPAVRAVVAYETENPDPASDLYGFLVAEPGTKPTPTVFYVYVKYAFRRSGIARRLFEAAGIDVRSNFLYVCKTDEVDEIVEAGKIPRARWCPLPARKQTRRAG
jgi:hypothetical protein